MRSVLLAWCLRTTSLSRENWKHDMPQWPMQGIHGGKVNTQNIEITLSKVGQCKGSAGSTALHRCEMYRAWRSSSSIYCCSNDSYTSAPHVICPHDIICDKRLRRACNNLEPVLLVYFQPDLRPLRVHDLQAERHEHARRRSRPSSYPTCHHWQHALRRACKSLGPVLLVHLLPPRSHTRKWKSKRNITIVPHRKLLLPSG